MILAPHITFSGNCREAMTYYRDCFGGELHFQTVEDSPHTFGLPKSFREAVVHATLHGENWMILGSDLPDTPQLKTGNRLCFQLHFESEAALNKAFQQLSEKGKALQQPDRNHWGQLVAEVEDSFRIRWQLIASSY